MDKRLQFQPIPSSSWASWSASLREKYRQGKREKAQLMRDYAGQGYKLKRGPQFITADQLLRNAAGVQKVILKKKPKMIHTSLPSMRHKPSGLSNAAFTAFQSLYRNFS